MIRLFLRMSGEWAEIHGHGCYTKEEVDSYTAMLVRLGTMNADFRWEGVPA